MKTKSTVIFILFLGSLLCQAQTVYLYTPKGTQVYAFSRSEMSQYDITFYNDQTINGYPQATFLANSSTTYNCHSYAWNMKEGGPTCWLNQSPDLHWYWDDYSYDSIPSDASATKIFYFNGDHSAVKSSVSGMYESKWGSLPFPAYSRRC